MTTSGYVGCACRDCMDIAIADSEEDAKEAMCFECVKHGCELNKECCCLDAYDVDGYSEAQEEEME